MFKLIIKDIAREILEELSNNNQKTFKIISNALDEIKDKGLKSSNIKKLVGFQKIFRKRIRRWRILFTIEGKEINIWLIAIKKDNRKDYKKWIRFIN